MIEDLFPYPQQADPDIRAVRQRVVEGAVVREFTFRTPHGWRRAAYLVRPEKETGTPHPGILYVHWYEPEAPDSNRTQFLKEAIQLATDGGAISLLVETMWSDRDWFLKRTQADDRTQAAQQVVELRQAMDILLAEPRVDPARFFYVGHDFGGMYGVLAGAVDQRPRGYVIMAATPRFPDWFLYYPQLDEAAAADFRQSFADLNPITHIAALSPAPVLFQFADSDPHVPEARAKAFFDAAAAPKEVRWYQTGHGLNEQATQERIAWLHEKLNLG